MHHMKVSDNYPWLPHNHDNASLPVPDKYKEMPIQPLGNKQKFYDDYVQGCVEYYGKKKGNRCYANERERITMNLRQPKSMVNYTSLGYTKMKAPPEVFELIRNFWERNKHNQKDEDWPIGNTYVNHWDNPSKIVSVEDTSLKGGGSVLKQHIWNAARDTISAWTGQQLAECSLYGIRVYKEGAMLAPHVDRLPLVASAIINVDQDVDEPWPLEVIGHSGHAVNITMEPGDLVLYESHSVIHGRQFPLKGRFMANIFVSCKVL
jgi:prolyl 4-hydroxylase